MSRIEISNINFEDADIKEERIIETYAKVNGLYVIQITPREILFSTSQEDAINLCECDDDSGDLDVWYVDNLIKHVEPSSIYVEQVVKTRITVMTEQKNDITGVVLKLATAIE